MKVIIQCSQCKLTNAIEEERLKSPEVKHRRCRQCGAFYDEEAIKEALTNTKTDDH